MTSHLSVFLRFTKLAVHTSVATGLFAAAATVVQPQAALAVRLDPIQVYMSRFSVPYLNGEAVPGSRATALTILDNEVVDHGDTGPVDEISTFMIERSPSHPDFVGLSYGEANRFDSISLEMGRILYQEKSPGYVDPGNNEVDTTGGAWAEMPKVYILKNTNLIGANATPSHAAGWVEVTGATLASSYDFLPDASSSQTGGTLTLDLSGIPAADRTGWGWAVEGVGNHDPQFPTFFAGYFVTLTEASADGETVASPSLYNPTTLEPTNVISMRYRSPQSAEPGMDDLGSLHNERGPAFNGVTNGHFHNFHEHDGFVTGQGEPTTRTDFVGLQYSTRTKFDTITLNMSKQYTTGGNWDEMPRVYMLVHPVDDGNIFVNLRPEENPDLYVEVDPELIGLTIYEGGPGGPAGWDVMGADITDTYEFLQDQGNTGSIPGVNMVFDLTSIPDEARTGWGWAIGGVDGNGTENFITVSELSATGTVIPGQWGDFNADGKVNIADYVVWRNTLGSNTILANDPTPGSVTESDLAIWSQFFGFDNSAGVGLGETAAVPEPSACLLVALMATFLFRNRRMFIPEN